MVDAPDDPAYSVIEHQLQDHRNAHLILTTPAHGCSGKVAALLSGLPHTQNAKILVFADSDIKPDMHWEQEKRKGSFARLATIEAHSYFGEMDPL